MGEQDASIVKLEPGDGVLVARVTCPVLNERESTVIEQEIVGVLGGCGHALALDLSKVTMIPSVGLGMLVRLLNACKAGGGKTALFGLNDNLRKLLKISAFDRLFVIVDTQEKAIKKIT